MQGVGSLSRRERAEGDRSQSAPAASSSACALLGTASLFLRSLQRSNAVCVTPREPSSFSPYVLLSSLNMSYSKGCEPYDGPASVWLQVMSLEFSVATGASTPPCPSSHTPPFITYPSIAQIKSLRPPLAVHIRCKRGGQPTRLEAIGPTLVNTLPTPTLNPSSVVMAAPLVVPEATVS